MIRNADISWAEVAMKHTPRVGVWLLWIALGACSSEPDDDVARSYTFGPYVIEPGQELADQCVSVTLGNDEAIFVNQVELSTGIGFHHSNWFWVPEHMFPGDDGTWSCRDRDYSEAIAGVFGGVVFAQSTQAAHEVQAFPPGVAVKIPPHAKLVAGTHLLNATEAPIAVSLTFGLGPIAEAETTTVLAGMAFQNDSIALPPHAVSRFTVECDLAPRHMALTGRLPDFKIYYMLPHYHELGSGMTIEAIRDGDGSRSMVYETAQRIGDALGGPIDPLFDMTGHSKLRFSCSYDNPRDATVRWGIGDQEMCVFLAFSDSAYTWGGGATGQEDPGPGVLNGGVIDFTKGCQVYVSDATH